MKLLKPLLAAAAIAACGTSALAQGGQSSVPLKRAAQKPPQTGPTARAAITGTGISGTLELIERKQGTHTFVEIQLTASGLTPGLHGVHLHAVGKCEPDFTAAGGHFDPGPAGNTDPDANHPFHMGDIPNLEVGKDGRGSLKATTTRITLSAGPLTVFDQDGTAIIIHGNPDQGVTGEPKSGVSGGPRVACGVLTRQ